MKHGKYTLRELFINRHIEQIVIPEIQRDYVWDKKQVEGLLKSIIEDFTEYSNFNLKEDIKDEEMKEQFENFIKKQKYSSNIGFIYAYDDSEYAGKYFLIDGQQRLTTLFLVLLALAKLSGKENDFQQLYLLEWGPKLDYKVREASHDFLQRFVRLILEGNIVDVEEQPWYYAEYKNDVTIQSLIANYSTIHAFLQTNIGDTAAFLDYINHFVEFWYFDTNISEQGEELYIYMNARGEQMQPNENIKADLLNKLTREQFASNDTLKDKTIPELKNYWGAEWEKWQNFFFRHRGEENENADKGFNEFLRWVLIIELAKHGNLNRVKKIIGEKEEEEKQSADELQSNDFEITAIHHYFSALEQLFDYENEWVTDGWIETKWLGVEQPLPKISLFKLLPALMVLGNSKKTLNSNDIKRLIRFFYSLSNISTVSKAATTTLISALKVSQLIIDEGITDIADLTRFSAKEDTENDGHAISKTLLSEEEQFKFLLYQSVPPDKRQRFEASFWEAEDHKLNSGRIEHLFQLCFFKAATDTFHLTADFFSRADIKSFDFDRFKDIKSSYYELIPASGKIDPRLRGHFLSTDLYQKGGGNEHWDGRIDYRGDVNINTSNDFLRLVLEIGKDSLASFLEKREKSYIQVQRTLLPSIHDEKEQLYVYFVLLNRQSLWNWDARKLNFGFYEEKQAAGSYFPRKTHFHFYAKKLKESVNHPVLEVNFWAEEQKYFDDLIAWSNQN